MSDVRIQSGFWTHPKTKKLARRCGPAGVLAFLKLWTFCGDTKGREDGDLSGLDDEDIELAADWDGEPGVFVAALSALRLVDGDELARHIHDWGEHQTWASQAGQRSKAGTRANLIRWHKEGKHAEPVAGCPACNDLSAPDQGGVRNGPKGSPHRTKAESASDKRGVPPSPPLPSLPFPSPPLPSEKEDAACAPKKAEKASEAKKRSTRAQKRDHKGMGANCMGPRNPSYWPPTTPQELLEAPFDEASGPQTFRDRIRERFPGYDGRDGRPHWGDLFKSAWAFWETDKRKGRWKTPAGFWTSMHSGPPGQPDYGVIHMRWKREQSEADGGRRIVTPVDADGRARERRDQERREDAQRRAQEEHDPAAFKLQMLNASRQAKGLAPLSSPPGRSAPEGPT